MALSSPMTKSNKEILYSRWFDILSRKERSSWNSEELKWAEYIEFDKIIKKEKALADSPTPLRENESTNVKTSPKNQSTSFINKTTIENMNEKLTNKHWGDVVKIELKKEDRSIAWLGRKLGYSTSHMNRVLSGTRFLPVNKMRELKSIVDSMSDPKEDASSETYEDVLFDMQQIMLEMQRLRINKH